MQRLFSLFLIFATLSTTLSWTSCVKAQQDDGEAQTVNSLVAVTYECDLIRDICSGINNGNVNEKGKLINEGFVSTTTVVDEIAFGLRAAGPGNFSNPQLIMQTGGKLAVSLKALLSVLKEKRNVLEHGGFKATILADLDKLLSSIDRMIEELYMRLTHEDQAEFEKTLSSLEDAFHDCVRSFS